MKEKLNKKEMTDSRYCLMYEKNKMQSYANSLENLALFFQSQERGQPSGDREKALFQNRIWENQVLLADQFRQIAKAMDSVAKERFRKIHLGRRKEKEIERLLALENIYVEDFYLLEKEDGKRQIVICAREGRSSDWLFSPKTNPSVKTVKTVENLAEYLTVCFNMPLVPSGEQTAYFLTDKNTYFYLEEEPKYLVLSGYAKATKEGENISGDNHVFFDTSAGKFYCLLSDGMGSGEKANKDSSMVLDMMERLLEAGFTEELSVQLLNNCLVARQEGGNMSTLDYCAIDYHTGNCEFLKMGACESYVKRDHHIEKIQWDSLPLGIFQEEKIEKQSRILSHGDYVFLWSDGVGASINFDFLEEVLETIPYRHPTEMANYLMKYVLQMHQGRVKDDITILVLGLWENRHRD